MRPSGVGPVWATGSAGWSRKNLAQVCGSFGLKHGLIKNGFVYMREPSTTQTGYIPRRQMNMDPRSKKKLLLGPHFWVPCLARGSFNKRPVRGPEARGLPRPRHLQEEGLQAALQRCPEGGPAFSVQNEAAVASTHHHVVTCRRGHPPNKDKNSPHVLRPTMGSTRVA